MGRGHGLEAVLHGYTMDQFIDFLDAGREEEFSNRARATMEMAVAMRMAFGADQPQWTKYMSDLGRSARKTRAKSKGRKSEVITKERARNLASILRGRRE